MSRLTEILLVCKDLIKDAKISCVDLVYKDTCLDILSKARLILNNEDFQELIAFVNENLGDEIIPSRRRKIRVR